MLKKFNNMFKSRINANKKSVLSQVQAGVIIEKVKKAKRVKKGASGKDRGEDHEIDYSDAKSDDEDFVGSAKESGSAVSEEEEDVNKEQKDAEKNRPEKIASLPEFAKSRQQGKKAASRSITNKSIDESSEKLANESDSSIASIFKSDDDLNDSEDDLPKLGEKRPHHQFDHHNGQSEFDHHQRKRF